MIKPVNGHLLIDPVKQDGFMASQHDTYQEVGIVLDADPDIFVDEAHHNEVLGSRVYFDSWLAAKYPKGEGDEFYWLVKWEDVRAIETTTATE